MSPSVRSRIFQALQVALVIIVFWLVWRRLGPELRGVSAADFARWRPAIGLLVLSTVGLTVVHLAQAFLWRRVVIDIGSPAPDMRTTVRVYFVSGLARFIPGSLWQFAGLAALGHEAGIRPLAAAAAGALGNLTFLAMGVVFLAFTLPAVAGGAERLLLGVLVAALTVVVMFAFTGTALGVRVRAWVIRRAPARLQPALELAGRIRPGHALVWILGYGASWVLLGASYVAFVAAFVPGASAHARELAGIMAASYLGGFLVLFAPAGLGVREGIMVALLAGMVPGPAAIVISVGHRVWFFVAEALALATFLVLPRRGGRRNGGAGGPGKVVDPGVVGGPVSASETSPPAPESQGAEAALPAPGAGRALVIIPTYNERDNISKIVPLVLAQDARIDVLVIDDNSPDGTGALADELAAAEARVHVMHRAGKLGLGTAYIAGFRWGLERGYGLLQEMDADFSHDPSHLPQFLEAAQQFDLVLGSRYLDGRVTVVNWPIKRLLLSYCANLYARIVTGLPVWDATAGFKCFRREVLEAIPLERIESEGYAFQIEMNFRAWRRGFRLGEIPIVFVDRTLGESKMSKRIIREAVTKVWKLRWLQLRRQA